MITVKYFANLRDIAGTDEDHFDLGSETTLQNLNDAIGRTHPKLKNMIHDRKIMVSINQNMVHLNCIVKDEDEVALLPPFSGGSSLNQGEI